ncbi:hypothetical protein L1765_13560 [Microaerobacter geothermalis]|uniref:hypothetical protein n=1 Tax=Microaerobacter geothermalis TaxID=674972 RepID=UPI001F1833E0|nr:hypothetical protein [Microaerobacter geothermalis]MCF6094988.1 hypothetical protein [Microaerobacter geothermalis]
MEKQFKVIIIREDEEGGQCCAALEGEYAMELEGKPLFEERRVIMENMGVLFSLLEKEFGPHIQIDMVDPRNQAYLIPRLIRDIREYRVPWLRGFKTIFGYRIPSIICNGELIASGKHIVIADVFEKIKELKEKEPA